MSLQFLSWPFFLLGAAALAAGLFVLQRLRVRHRPHRVVTTMFWKEAVEESRARVLTQRFRHPWAYALLLLIAVALWFAFGDPKFGGEGETDHVVLLDASAAMNTDGRFQRALDALPEEVAKLPSDQRKVLLVGSSTESLLAPGENARLLEERLSGIKPEDAPSNLAAALRRRAKNVSKPTVFYIADTAFLAEADLEGLPEQVEVQRLALGGDSTTSPDAGLTALGVSPALSGAFDRVDVFVSFESGAPRGLAGLSLTIDGKPFATAAAHEREGITESIVLRDVPARGQTVEATLNDAANTLASFAQAKLPTRRRLKTVLGADLPVALVVLLESDPALEITTAVDDADLAVVRSGDPIAGGRPSFELRPRQGEDPTFEIRHEADFDSQDFLLDSFRELGLDQIDAVELADVARAPITVTARASDSRGVSVWAELFEEAYDFTDSRAFPLFVSSALRWMAGVEDFPARVAVGESLRPAPKSGGWTADGQVKIVTAGGDLKPPAAGRIRDAKDSELLVSYLAPPSADRGESVPVQKESKMPGGDTNLVTIILLLAGALLLLEWFLYSTGRVP